jgi:hypothetical protein
MLHPTGAVCSSPNPTASKYGDVPGRWSSGSNLYPCEWSCTPIGVCRSVDTNAGNAKAGVASKNTANIVYEKR